MERLIGHISDEDLERYSAFSETLADQKKSLIRDHLSKCAYCSRELESAKEFYQKLQDQLSRDPLEDDIRLSQALAGQGADGYLQYRGLSRTTRSIVDAAFETLPSGHRCLTRTITYVKGHPIAIGSFAIALVVFLLVLFNESDNLRPTIYNLTPQTLLGKNSFDTLYIRGSGFQPNLKVRLRNFPNDTIYEKQPLTASGTTIVLAVRVGTDPGKWWIQVLNPDGKLSKEVEFGVTAPKPQRPWLIPTRAVAGSPALTIVITGNTYNSSSIVRWNGRDRPTLPLVAKGGLVMGLKVTIPAADISVPGSAQVTVFNPPPGGGLSTAASFEIIERNSK